MIRAGIDDEGRIGERVGVLPGLTVRQSEEHDVVPGEDVGRRVPELEVRERAQVRLVQRERLTRVGMRGHRRDLDVGVCGEQAQDLAARIAGSAGNGDRIGHLSTLLSVVTPLVTRQGPEDGDTRTSTRRWRGEAVPPRVGGRPGVGAHETPQER